MFFRFATKHACDGQTDGQTDGQNYDLQDRASIYTSRGKNRPRNAKVIVENKVAPFLSGYGEIQLVYACCI